MKLSRRRFAAAFGSGAAAFAQTPGDGRGTIPEAPPFGETLTFARAGVAPKAEPFPMPQVRLLPGAFHDAQEWNRAYLHRLDAERLLHNFRLNAGLPSSAQPLGGWEEPKGELRGHFTGHYLSAAALTYASTGDREIKAKAGLLVAELAKCQATLGGGYLSAFPREFWDRLDARKKVWAPFYTIHKIMAGMFDVYRLTGNRQALQVLEGMAGWADEWSASKSEAHMQDILDTEYGGMNDILYELAAVANDDRWARAGDRFTKKRFFNPLALRRDELRGLHVNTHIPQVIGAARRYEISGDLRFRDVADFFWYEVVGARTYVTAGTSNGEGWLTPPRQLAAELKRSVATAECCCCYNMMKLTRHLYGWSASPGYFDYYERALLNHRLGTIRPRTGATQYYLSLTPGAWKTFGTEDQSFWCCTGTGVEEYSKLNDSIYWRDRDGVFVNLFVASELDWSERGVRIRQETKFPDQASTTLAFSARSPVQLAVRLRVPAWLERSPAVRLNGRPLEVSAEPGSYLTLSRTWKTGDRVEMDLPMSLHTEAMPDDPRMIAILHGPLVLAGDLGGEGLDERNIVGPSAPRLRTAGTPPPADADGPRGIAPIDVPAFRAAGRPVDSWVRPGDTPLEFHTTGQPRDVRLVPLNRLFDRRYSVYWQLV